MMRTFAAMFKNKEIRNKIKSVQNTKKITKAMEMVAASKMRKAQDRMRAARPYAEKIRRVIVVDDILTSGATMEACASVLRQAGVRHTWLKLEDIGIDGNSHFMFIEENSDQVAGVVLNWLHRHVLRKPHRYGEGRPN